MKRLAALALALLGCNSSPANPGSDGGGGDGGNCAPLALRPQARQRVGGVLVPSTQKILVYGGDEAPVSTALPAPRQLTDDLWSYDLACATWAQLGAQQPPGALGEYVAVFDSKRGRAILVPGQKGTTRNPALTSELWAFDPQAMTWTQLHPTAAGGASPSARVGHGAIYDAGRDRLLVFGGETSINFSGADMLGDTWALDFAASADGAWSKLAAGPLARRDGALAVDAAGNRAVLFGGARDFMTYVNDVWVFDLVADTWKQANTSGDVPSARFAAKMSFDGASRFILFGGHDPAALGPLNDSYALTVDGAGAAVFKLLLAGDTDTTVAGVDHSSPERRERHAQIFAGGKIWIFGGSSDCGPLDDVWTLDLAAPTRWTTVVPAKIDETCQRRAMPGQLCQPPPMDCTTPL